MRRAVLAAGLGVAMAAGIAGGTAGAESYKGYEMPPYKVEAEEGAYELRTYASHLVAEVRVSGSRDRAIGAGFRVLAGYIFGGNDRGEKIAMTVPVAQTPVAGGEWTVRFMMPMAFSPADLPVPRDGSIRFVTIQPERQVSLTFSGARGDRILATRADELRAWARRNGHTVIAGPHYYFYDGPMTLPWNRRNEVAFTVK
jgi:SOUL heme-binding protein